MELAATGGAALMTIGAISTIFSTTANILEIIKIVTSYKLPSVVMELNKLDLEYNLILINSILQTYKEELTPRSTESDSDSKASEDEKIINLVSLNSGHEIKLKDKNSFYISLYYINDIMKEIYDCLEKIQIKVRKHQHKFLRRFRSLNIGHDMSRLKIKMKILTHRFEDLLKIIQIQNYKL